MSELEFLPAWYTRMLRRRRLALLSAIIALFIAAVIAAATR